MFKQLLAVFLIVLATPAWSKTEDPTSSVLPVSAYGTYNGAILPLQVDASGAVVTSGGSGGGGTGNVGIGTVNFVPEYIGVSTLGPSNIVAVAGNVGIGSVTPGATLDVNGPIRSISAGASYFNGTLGIGTTTPGQSLDIFGGNARINGTNELYFGSDNRNGIANTASTTGDMRFFGGLSEVMRVTNTGTLGIGTSTATNLVTVGTTGSGSGVFYTLGAIYAPNSAANGGVALNLGKDSTHNLSLTWDNSIPAAVFQTSSNAYAINFAGAASSFTTAGTIQFIGNANDYFTPTGGVGIGDNGRSLGSKLNISSNVSIGTTYYTTAAPANGVIIQGNVGLGTLAPIGKLNIFSTTGIGWTVKSGANTACNTTCPSTSGCVFGEDTSVIGTFVACTDATADICICAGP